MKLRTLAVLTAAIVASPGAWAANQQASGTANPQPKVLSARPDYTPAMEKLRQAAQHLRESIQAIAGKPAGAGRDRAIAQAREALWETQRAMTALPPELRATGSTIRGQSYERGLEQLDKAADKLWQSLDAMSRDQDDERARQAIARAHQALWETYEAMLAMPAPDRSQRVASATAGGNGSANGSAKGGNANGGQAKGQEAYGVVVVPVHIASDDKLADGCWARIYENPNYGGSALTLVGPVEVANLGRTAADDWNGPDSIIAGPKARVDLYDSEDYGEPMAAVRQGQHVADLRDGSVGPLDEAESVRVTCTG